MIGVAATLDTTMVNKMSMDKVKISTAKAKMSMVNGSIRRNIRRANAEEKLCSRRCNGHNIECLKTA